MDIRRLEQIERRILDFFKTQQRTRVLAKELFANFDDISNADIVRAIEALEKKSRLLVRHTSEGDDYVSLTPDGAQLVNLAEPDPQDTTTAIPHPPRSATRRL
jgi:DNA-binding MarR family transcriptional regulator